MAPPTDVFPALFGALRDRLAIRMSAFDSTTLTDKSRVSSIPVTASLQVTSDALSSSLSTFSPIVHRCYLEEIRYNTRTRKLQLRHKRLDVRRARVANWRRRKRLDAVVAAEGDVALLDVSTHNHRFKSYVTETDTQAAGRLETLFFECIAEMKKALVRMEKITADTTTESERMIEELQRCHEWQLFLTRLQQECGGHVEASLLVPSAHNKSSSNHSSSLLQSSGQETRSDASMRAILQTILDEHGPTMESGNMLTVRSVIAFHRPKSARGKRSRLPPTVHFGASAAELLTKMLAKMTSSETSTKSRQTASLSSPSTCRDHRLPSTLRQLTTKNTLQFPGTACDIPLSVAYIRWMLSSSFNSQDSVRKETTSKWWQLADSNIYFDTAEYERQFTAVMKNYTTSATLDGAREMFAVNQAALASARRSLREISAILERPREQREEYSADTVFAARLIRSDDHNSNGPSNQRRVDDKSPTLFARASVLQLVQTVYYSKCFLPLLLAADADTLKRLYPIEFFGEASLSTLYIAVTTGQQERHARPIEGAMGSSTTPTVSMVPLDDHVIHELLLVYTARKRNELTKEVCTGVKTGQEWKSLARSDALSTLVPYRQADSSETRFCMIQNALKMWKQGKEPRSQDVSDELRRLLDADAIFVECTVSSTQAGIARASTKAKSQAVSEVLGTSCMWRSCVTSQDLQEGQNKASLCLWHKAIERFLAPNESMQYVPNESRLSEALVAIESDLVAGRTARIIWAASPLLEEISSRHLSLSIQTFFQHVIGALSNRTYQTEFLGTVHLDASDDENVTSSDLERSRYELQRLADCSNEIWKTEKCVTKELRRFVQLTACHGIEDSFIYLDVKELQSNIRTNDLDLRLHLSRQKLQTVERWQRDKAKQAAWKLTPSTSLSNITVYSTLEQKRLRPSSVYDVVHVMRKGRQSLLRQQAGSVTERNGAKGNTSPA